MNFHNTIRPITYYNCNILKIIIIQLNMYNNMRLTFDCVNFKYKSERIILVLKIE